MRLDEERLALGVPVEDRSACKGAGEAIPAAQKPSRASCARWTSESLRPHHLGPRHFTAGTHTAAELAVRMPNAATQTSDDGLRLERPPRTALASPAPSDLREDGDTLSGEEATGACAVVGCTPPSDLYDDAGKTKRRDRPASLLSLPDELLEQVYRELHHLLATDSSDEYLNDSLIPPLSYLLVAKRSTRSLGRSGSPR